MAYKTEIIVRALDEASAVFRKMGANADRELANVKKQTDMANKSLDYLKTAAISATVAFGVKGAWDWLVKSNAQMEQAEIGFGTMLKSADKAKAFLDELQQFAAKTPFEFTELRSSASRMLAFGFSAEQVLPVLTAVGDAASAVGLGDEGIKRITWALGQMKAKAKVSAEEMLQLTEAGIPAWDMLAEKMGKSTAQLMDMSRDGAIPANEAIQALVKGMEERFPGMMEKQSKTMGGMISNLKDYSELAGRTLGKGVFEQIKPQVEDAMNALSRLQQSGKLEEWGQSIGRAMQFAAEHGKTFLAVASGFATTMVISKSVEGLAIALDTLGKSELFAKSATEGLDVALKRSTVGLIASAVGALVTVAMLYKTTMKETTDVLTQNLEKAKEDVELTKSQVSETVQHIQVLNTLKGQYATLSESVSNNTNTDKQLATAKISLADVERKLIPIIGQEGLERIKGAENTEKAFNTEISAMEQKLTAQREAVERARDLEFTQTDNLIKATETRVAAIEAEQVAYGALNKTKVWLMEQTNKINESIANANPVTSKILGFSEDTKQRARDDIDLNKRLIGEVIDASKSPALSAARQELSRLRGGLISLGGVSTGLGGLGGGLSGIGDAGSKAEQHLASLGSAFSTVSGLMGESSKSSLLEAQNALMDIAAEAEKAGATDIAASLEEAMAQLPAIMADKTGAAAKVVIGQLYGIAEAAADVSSETGQKIWNLSQIAVSKIDEQIAGSRREWVNSLNDLGKEIGGAVGTGSEEAKTKASDMIEDIMANAQELANLGDPVAKELVRVMTLAMGQLPGAVADYTGKAGEELLAIIKDVCVRINKYTGDSSLEIRRSFRDAFQEAAKQAQEMTQKMQEELSRVGEIYTDMNTKLADANTSYADSVASVNQKLKEDLADLRDDLEDQIDDIISKYKEWIGLFDEAPKKQYVSATKLLRNLTEQNRQMKQFYDTLGDLSRRGVDSGLIDELKAMGPKALPQILALSRMTDTQLQQYVALWREKGSLAGDAASDEIEEAREEMLKSQQKMRDDAKKELERLRQEYEKQMKEIKDDTEDTLKDMAKDAKEQGEKFVVNLLSGIKEKYPALAAYIDKIAGEMGISGVSSSGTGTTKSADQMTTAEKEAFIKKAFADKKLTGGVNKEKGTVEVMTGRNGEFTKFTYDEFIKWAQGGASTSGGTSSGGTSSGGSGSGGSGGSGNNPSYRFASSDYKLIGDTAAIQARNFENYGYTVGWDASTGKVLINGKTFSPLDIDSNDRAWVGLRQVFEAMGRRVEWDSSSGAVNVYHKGGQVSKLGPKEVPIIAEEGEIIFPNTHAAVNFERALEKHADRLIKAMAERFNFTIEKLFAPENVNVNKEADWDKISRKMTNDLLLAVAK